MEYSLIIELENKEKLKLFEGYSYVRKNLADYLFISSSCINLVFCRSKKVNIYEALNSSHSLIRYELQRALCFYLATLGYISTVSKVKLISNDTEMIIDNEVFPKSWSSYRIDETLPVERTRAIFEHNIHAKDLYISMTYYIKAQMANFDNDCYRAAWTGINSIYRLLRKTDKESEQNQINRFKERFSMETTVNGRIVLDSFTEKEWQEFEWYVFANRVKEKKDIYLSPNYCGDYRVLGAMTCAFKHILNKKEKNSFDTPVNIRKIIENKEINDVDCLKFLVCDYCYMIRNRYFHAAKAYPLFVISEGAEMAIESKLTKLLIACMKDYISVGVFEE